VCEQKRSYLNIVHIVRYVLSCVTFIKPMFNEIPFINQGTLFD